MCTAPRDRVSVSAGTRGAWHRPDYTGCPIEAGRDFTCSGPVVMDRGGSGPNPQPTRERQWAVLTVHVEDLGFLQLEFPDVPLVSPQPLGVPEHSSG